MGIFRQNGHFFKGFGSLGARVQILVVREAIWKNAGSLEG
jgi:hypothetical protein